MFLGILGHDLRNPLNTILTTAQLMLLRNDLDADNARRIERLSLSGRRMKLMVDQLLDMTQARLGGGFPIDPTVQALAPLISRIVDECQAAYPSSLIQSHLDPACHASIDGDRFEQVVSNLLGNAITHGDATRPIVVTMSRHDSLVTISVLNHGPPIDGSTLAQLFDPFRRGRQVSHPSEGLGLGLYISERIVAAHGGTIAVTSSWEAGTEFRVHLACHDSDR